MNTTEMGDGAKLNAAFFFRFVVARRSTSKRFFNAVGT